MFLFYPTYNSIVILYSMFDTVDWVSMEDIWFVRRKKTSTAIVESSLGEI